MAKRKADPYGPETTWFKIKNRAYTQAEGRCELFPEGLSLAPGRVDSLGTPAYISGAFPRQRHTWRKPGPQSHGSSPPP